MATLKLQNANVVLRDGLLSCDCCFNCPSVISNQFDSFANPSQFIKNTSVGSALLNGGQFVITQNETTNFLVTRSDGWTFDLEFSTSNVVRTVNFPAQNCIVSYNETVQAQASMVFLAPATNIGGQVVQRSDDTPIVGPVSCSLQNLIQIITPYKATPQSPSQTKLVVGVRNLVFFDFLVFNQPNLQTPIDRIVFVHLCGNELSSNTALTLPPNATQNHNITFMGDSVPALSYLYAEHVPIPQFAYPVQTFVVNSFSSSVTTSWQFIAAAP